MGSIKTKTKAEIEKEKICKEIVDNEKGHNEKGRNEKGQNEEALRREREAVKGLLNLSDEEILDIIRKKTEELGRVPKKAEVPGASYIKRRFGPWHRVLEAAGVREVTPERIARLNARKNKKRRRAQ